MVKKTSKNIKSPYITLILSVISLSLYTSPANSKQRIGEELTANGSKRGAFTIFTNPSEDCSTSMNISWGSPPGTECEIELTDEETGEVTIYGYNETDLFTMDQNGKNTSSKDPYFSESINYPYLCKTFDNIHSKLANGKDVYERHVFDKHRYELTGLKPDTDYKYRIISWNPDTQKEEYSAYHFFHTAGANSWKAAIIGDFHHYSPSWSRLEYAMGMLDTLYDVADRVDWVLCTGDQSSWGGSYNFWTEMSEQPGFKDFMWAAVQGNHDHETRDRVKSDNFFRDSHYFPPNGYAGQEGVTYWFRYGDVLFFMLNNEAMLKSGSLTPVFEWMEKVVDENPSKYIVVVAHHQWLIGTDGSNSQLDRFRKLFDKLGVDLALSGHNHPYLRTKPLYDRQPVAPEEGTVYVVNCSSDNSRGRALKPLVANKDIIEKRWSEGSNNVGGMVMDVNPERIEMTFYNRYGEVVDQFTVPAKR